MVSSPHEGCKRWRRHVRGSTITITTTRKVTVARRLKQRSINTTRMDRNKAPEHLDVLYLLSTALLPVLNYSMKEAHFTPSFGDHGLG